MLWSREKSGISSVPPVAAVPTWDRFKALLYLLEGLTPAPQDTVTPLLVPQSGFVFLVVYCPASMYVALRHAKS